MHLEIVTSENKIFEGEVAIVTFPEPMGRFR